MVEQAVQDWYAAVVAKTCGLNLCDQRAFSKGNHQRHGRLIPTREETNLITFF